MVIDSLPVAVLMQRRTVRHLWADEVWAAIGVVPDPGGLPPLQPLEQGGERETYLVAGLRLELHRDENDGYFENWVAPQPKVFVMWQMREGRAMPVLASLSYTEGARMLDSGEGADGVAMPPEIHAWLARYLKAHYRPRERRGREHG
ncbi:DUF3305 domain-containing protein [Caldimonas tepidiphila]|uniref:DUF3305 domain-containing protein n=1 Tax=Caldimonas tepidiphila TaxID=2315841 RepID=UPI000E5ADDAF|nr:DUF3305 domain-containing protein [Caldimonas tepidiphila]